MFLPRHYLPSILVLSALSALHCGGSGNSPGAGGAGSDGGASSSSTSESSTSESSTSANSTSANSTSANSTSASSTSSGGSPSFSCTKRPASFAADVMPIFHKSCAVPYCHQTSLGSAPSAYK